MFGRSELIEDMRREVCDLKARTCGQVSNLYRAPVDGLTILTIKPSLESRVGALEKKIDAIAEHLGCEFKDRPAELVLEKKDDSNE